MASKQYCFLFFIIALLLSSFVVAKVDVVPDEVTGEVCFNDRFCNVVDDCIVKRFEETVDAKDIHIHLQELYDAQTGSVRHATVKELMMARMQDGASVHEHGVKMIGLIEKSVNLDLVIPHELSTDIILLSLPSSFDNFVINLNMNKLKATLEELVNMLANYEATMKKRKNLFSLWVHLLDPRKDPRKRERSILLL
ncbi:hypothetical protein ZIOFF_075671 [Zingiber officinale]|uniref:Uncharacterized protein n=1 Tax=Zingiber officinale TaxID=94328 RepID=A0A8J5E8C2_ZINOF|nr:hypothetical protein ZIOFF_075671 [Zingiber officinale]